MLHVERRPHGADRDARERLEGGDLLRDGLVVWIAPVVVDGLGRGVQGEPETDGQHESLRRRKVQIKQSSSIFTKEY